MKFNGMWFNPAYAGEGLALEQYDDGTVIAKVFTYGDHGTQMWLIGVGQADGPHCMLQCSITEGGAFGSTDNPETVDETGRGDLMLFRESEDRIRMTYDYGDQHIVYTLEPLYQPGGEPDPEPEPEPDPTPENPFEGKVSFRIKPFKWQGDWLDGEYWLQDGKWYGIWSTAQILWTSLGSGRNTMLQIEITAHERLTITSQGASGYGAPSWRGVPNVIEAGETVEVSCEVNKASRPSGHANANFQLDTNLGTLVLYTTRVLGGQ